MPNPKDSYEWNYCSKTWKGRPCLNKARYKNGSQCCTCANRAVIAKDPERVKKYHKDYYDKNPEKLKAKQKRYRERNRQQEIDRCWLYRYNNPDKVKAYAKQVHNQRKRAKYAAKRTLSCSPGATAPASERSEVFAQGASQAPASEPADQT